MALTKEDLQAISALLDDKLAPIKSEIAEIKEAVNIHRDLTLEFYGKQMEHNTRSDEKMDHLGARVDIFENQTVRNTTDIRKIKGA